jgi:PPOX class probable F420-dependent enzyme
MLAEARIAHLGLLDDRDRPRVLPVTFALHDAFLYTAIDDKPKRLRGKDVARVRFLRRRPEAAITVDHYEDDWERLAWVQVLGRIEVLEVDSDRPGFDALRDKYEAYREAPPAGPLLRLAPERALSWRAADRTHSAYRDKF